MVEVGKSANGVTYPLQQVDVDLTGEDFFAGQLLPRKERSSHWVT
jgi:hypothetical protein